MPLYDYECRSCRHITEVRHGFGETYDAGCPTCGGVLKRVFNPAGIVFKGSGFYVTDSRKGASGEAKGDGGGASEKKTDGAKTDGAKTDGAKSDGAKSDGAKSDGAKADGAKPAAKSGDSAAA